jgi:hypothetical protein
LIRNYSSAPTQKKCVCCKAFLAMNHRSKFLKRTVARVWPFMMTTMGNDKRLGYCLIATVVLIMIVAGVHSSVSPLTRLGGIAGEEIIPRRTPRLTLRTRVAPASGKQVR